MRRPTYKASRLSGRYIAWRKAREKERAEGISALWRLGDYDRQRAMYHYPHIFADDLEGACRDADVANDADLARLAEQIREQFHRKRAEFFVGRAIERATRLYVTW